MKILDLRQKFKWDYWECFSYVYIPYIYERLEGMSVAEFEKMMLGMNFPSLPDPNVILGKDEDIYSNIYFKIFYRIFK